MRGFPPIQIFLLVLAFGLLAVPLAKLTGNAAHAPLSPLRTEAPQTQLTPVLLRFNFAHPPLSLSLRQGSHTLVQEVKMSQVPWELKTEMSLLKDGDELSLDVTWPQGTPNTAITCEIEPDGHEAESRTLWTTSAELHEILTFVW